MITNGKFKILENINTTAVAFLSRKHSIHKETIISSSLNFNVKESPLLSKPERIRSNSHAKSIAEGLKEKKIKERSVEACNNINNPQKSRPHINGQTSLPSSFKR